MMQRYRLSRTSPVLFPEKECDDEHHHYGAWISASEVDAEIAAAEERGYAKGKADLYARAAEELREAEERGAKAERERIIETVKDDGYQIAIEWRKDADPKWPDVVRGHIHHFARTLRDALLAGQEEKPRLSVEVQEGYEPVSTPPADAGLREAVGKIADWCHEEDDGSSAGAAYGHAEAMLRIALAAAKPAMDALRKSERVILDNLVTRDVNERTVTLTVSTALWENWQSDTRHHPAPVEKPKEGK